MDATKSCTSIFDLNTLNVTKTGTGTGTITSIPAGIDCGDDCSEVYSVGEEVTLAAAPDAGSVFSGWNGDADCLDGVITMNTASSCTARFDLNILTIIKAGAGGGTVISTPTGIDCGDDCSEEYPVGEEVTLAATPDAGSVFSGWNGDADCSDGVIAMNIATSCTAVFDLHINALTIEKVGTGSGTVASAPAGIDCGADCFEDYAYGTEVILTATPDTGSDFTGWSGDPDCSDGVVTMNTAKTCTAIFDIEIQTLNVAKTGTGSGTVASVPAGISCGADCSEDYTYGTVVALTAAPGAGSDFTSWSGDPDCSDGAVTMDAAKTCTVTFTITPFLIEVPIAASSDDAEEGASGGMSLTSSDLEMTLEGSIQTVGMRFNLVDIPEGATITNANIQFQTDEINSEPSTLTIEGEASDNALTFTSASGNITSRARTASSVEWTPAPWLTVGEAGPDQQTADISTVVQEIVDQPGWTSGNSIVIIITGTGKRVADSYNGTATGAPLLHVEYSTVPPEPSVLTYIMLTPDPASVVVGGTQQFTVTGYDQYGATMAIDPPDWSTSGGGTIDATGLYTANLTPGMFTITATDPGTGIFGQATVEVREAPVLTDIFVSPDPATLVVGATQAFTATGYDQYGAPVPFTAEWTATGGTIDPAGEYTAGLTPGAFQVTAMDLPTGIFSIATVTVTDAVTTLDVQVAAGSDDAEEAAGGGMYLTSSDLELVFTSSNQTIGMRFNSLNIPADATITNAYIQFTVDETPSGPTDLTIHGEASSNAATFTSASGNISGRPLTGASVGWLPDPWLAVGDAGVAQQTPDIASIIEEIVSSANGWASGNSLAIIITGTGTRIAESYNGVPAAAPMLHVEYIASP
jgi:hypothetical protein